MEAALQRMRETKFLGMEYFGSRDETTQRASLDEVDRSHVYVGIFGGRYGSGITEDEYDRARERSLPCFIYFKAEGTILPDAKESNADGGSRLAAPLAMYQAIQTGSGAIAQGTGAVAAGAGGVAIGGNVHGSNIVTGSHNVVRATKTQRKRGMTVADFTAVLAQIRQALDKAGLDAKTRRVICADLDAVDAEARDAQPSKPIIETKLKSIESMAKSMEGIGSAAIGLIPLIQKAFELAQQIFR